MGNKEWIAFANEKKCNHAKSLIKSGFISWVNTANFEVGDIVAIAQPYSDLRFTPVECVRQGKIINISKAVVNPKYMEHHVIIEDVSLKRISDFTEQDCLDMGIAKDISTGIPKYIMS